QSFREDDRFCRRITEIIRAGLRYRSTKTPITHDDIYEMQSCGGEMIQKSRWRLFIVGVLLSASIAIAFFFPYFWAPGIILELTGLYLMVWATFGEGCWCRTCKKLSIF